jgi:ribonucleoside-diphosphate reductase alpha chain
VATWSRCPTHFVSALDDVGGGPPRDDGGGAAFVDTAISKTVNVPADYPYDDFKGLYQQAWRAGLKGLATYRPNSILGSVLEVDAARRAAGRAAPARARRWTRCAP